MEDLLSYFVVLAPVALLIAYLYVRAQGPLEDEDDTYP